MSVLSKLIHRFNAILSKAQDDFFEKKKKRIVGEISLPYFTTYSRTTVIKAMWYRLHRSMEHNRESRSRPTQVCPIDF